MTEEQKEILDVVIIGAGPGGMTAALYASRANLNVLLLERGVPGGEMINTADIDNYPGFDSILGPELADKMYHSAMQFGAKHSYGNVKEIIDGPEYKTIIAGKKEYYTKTIIIATGSTHRPLGVPGEDEYRGRGVSYCAVCDGAFFKNEDLIVVGGGDSAVEEGTYLTQFADKVSIVHRRDALRAQQIIQNRAFNNDKINFTWDTVVTEILGDDKKVTGVKIQNVKDGEEQVVDAAGVFIYVGLLPNTDQFRSLGITDDEGWIVTDELMATAVPGIFAVGDVRKKVLRQITTAVGDGGIAGQEVYNYIQALND